ncbi:MAG: hypothetical protein K6U88_03495, partial [Dehalococcoidia bacterium]|nr:hypothetical protein [Dehalococcoidia bacterium]
TRTISMDSRRQDDPTDLKEAPAILQDTGLLRTESTKLVSSFRTDEISESNSTRPPAASSKDDALDLLTDAVDLIGKLKTTIGWHQEALRLVQHAEQDFNHAFEILNQE